MSDPVVPATTTVPADAPPVVSNVATTTVADVPSATTAGGPAATGAPSAVGDLCLPLTGSKMCPDFTSLSAYISVDTPVKTVTDFDNLIASSIDLSNITSSFGGLARTYCPAWDGTGLRYYQSALCGYFVGFGFAQGPSTGGPKCNPSNTTFTLCASTMTKYVAAWTKLFSNPTLCPKNDLVSYASGYSRNSAVLSSSATCIVGEGKDTSNCGFNTAAEAKTFCASNPSGEPCCTAFAPASTSAAAPPTSSKAAVIATSSVVAPLATTVAAAAASSSGMSQNTIIYIAAGSGAGLLLIILIVVLCCCCRRKRTQPEYPSQFDNNVAMKNMNGASAGPYGPSGSERTMLNQNAAPMGMGPPPPMSPGGPGGAKDMYTAVYDYAPAQSDELEAFVGDKIIIKTEFDDGWAFGFNTRSRKEGHFPLDILDKYAQQNQAFGQNGGPSVYSKRASSMYGPQGGQQSVYGTDSMYAPGQQSMYGTASVYAPGQESMYVDNGKVHKVVYDFNPEQKDEAELRVGDSIQLKQEYDDGWGHGLNLTTGQTGLFPLDCLEGFENQEFDDQGQKKNKLRASSIYGGGQDSVYYGNAGNTQSVYSEYAPGTDSVYYNAPQGGRR